MEPTNNAPAATSQPEDSDDKTDLISFDTSVTANIHEALQLGKRRTVMRYGTARFVRGLSGGASEGTTSASATKSSSDELSSSPPSAKKQTPDVLIIESLSQPPNTEEKKMKYYTADDGPATPRAVGLSTTNYATTYHSSHPLNALSDFSDHDLAYESDGLSDSDDMLIIESLPLLNTLRKDPNQSPSSEIYGDSALTDHEVVDLTSSPPVMTTGKFSVACTTSPGTWIVNRFVSRSRLSTTDSPSVTVPAPAYPIDTMIDQGPSASPPVVSQRVLLQTRKKSAFTTIVM